MSVRRQDHAGSGKCSTAQHEYMYVRLVLVAFSRFQAIESSSRVRSYQGRSGKRSPLSLPQGSESGSEIVVRSHAPSTSNIKCARIARVVPATLQCSCNSARNVVPRLQNPSGLSEKDNWSMESTTCQSGVPRFGRNPVIPTTVPHTI
jgi:hypothetical protein